MIQLIQENRRPRQPKFSERLLSGLGSLASEATSQVPRMLMGRQQEGRENEAIKRLTGQDVSGLTPQLKKVLLEKHYGAQGAKQQEKQATLQHAVDSISHMRDLIQEGGTGFSLKAFTPEGWGNRSGFDTAALNLEKLAADMVGKGTLNQQRFKYLKERLPSSWKTDEQNMKILDEWERILAEPGSDEGVSKKGKTKFNASHPEHKAKATQLYKKYNDKERVRKELAKEFEF